MAGLHVGYVTGTYPGSQAPHFVPIHVEARYSYVFGDDPIGKAGLHPFILGGLGIGEFDGSVSVSVYEEPNPTSCTQANVKFCSPTVSAWQTGGPFFFEAGGGARWEFVPGVAAMADLKLVGAVGGSSGFRFVPTPEVAAQFGLTLRVQPVGHPEANAVHVEANAVHVGFFGLRPFRMTVKDRAERRSLWRTESVLGELVVQLLHDIRVALVRVRQHPMKLVVVALRQAGSLGHDVDDVEAPWPAVDDVVDEHRGVADVADRFGFGVDGAVAVLG